ncbi:MAG: hypothetical protein HOM62_14065 [Rhodospirillaceae bacterium]|nr:hypothetical protein [Rhodospirillaceae bacterium]
MAEQVSSDAISAMALKMYSQDELDLMSREQLMPIYSLAQANALKPEPPTQEELDHQREVLERSLLHPAIESWRAANMDNPAPAKAKAPEPKEMPEGVEPQHPVPEDDFWRAVERYAPEWLGTYVSTVINYSIDRQIQLADGKIQVVFSTLECDLEQDEDDDFTYGYRFVCVVSFNEARGRWGVENHEEPMEI